MVGVGVEIDAVQLIKDLNASVNKLKDKKVQREIDALLAVLTQILRDNQAKIFELEQENRKLRKTKQYKFAENGELYLIDPTHPDRKLCPVCTPEMNSAVPLLDYYCQHCQADYEK